jgi:sugar phosphate isomerase/epimerase
VDVPEEKRIEALTFLVDFMKSSAPTAEKSGVVVGLENMHYNPGWLIRSHQELVHAVDAIDSPAVGITFDSGHAWGSGGIDNGIAAFGDRIRHVQVHDARGLEGAGDVRDQHLEIGTGILDFTSIGELVKTKPFVVTFETATRGDDPIGAVLRSRERLLELWG